MTLTITATVESKLKKLPLDSTHPDLQGPGKTSPFPRGKSFQVESWEKSENDHIKVELKYGGGTWHFFDPHVYFPPVDDVVAVAQRRGQSKFLTEKDYVEAARMIGCEVAAIKAVAKVESNGGGFYTRGRLKGKPVILFESHIFGKYSGYRFNKSHPILSQVNWNRRLYKVGGHSWDKLNQACELDESAALRACSWGKFQIMGFHAKTCGFATPQEYAKAQHHSEFEHLRCFIAFIKSKRLDRFIRNLDFKSFAYRYNGEYYWKNQYDVKMANAYRAFA